MRGFVLLICLLNSCCHIQCVCNSFGDITVELQPKQGEAYYQDITGCADPTTVDRNTTEVIIRDEHVPHLRFGAVQNLAKVKKVEFMKCSIEIIEAGAFRNLPRLKEVVMRFNRIELIPRGFFKTLPALEEVRLDLNEIKVIEDQAFANLPKLKRLFVYENRVETWRSTWFTNTTSLEELGFNDNIIRRLPENAFRSLRKLTRINLDHNEISVIEPGAFKGLRHLEYLGLKHNLLTTIEPNMFPEDMTVEELEIGANKLNFLANEVLNRISVKKLSLEGNPWKCPCFDRILFWLNQNGGSVVSSLYCADADIPKCVFPRIYSQTCLENVDEEVAQVYLKQVKVATKDIDSFKWERCVRFD